MPAPATAPAPPQVAVRLPPAALPDLPTLPALPALPVLLRLLTCLFMMLAGPGLAQTEAASAADDPPPLADAPPAKPAAPARPAVPAPPPRRPANATPARYEIVTADERSTAYEVGRDLGRLVAEPAGFTLRAVHTAGSSENVRRLRQDPDVKFALLQADVIQAYVDEAAAGNAEAADLIQRLRLVLPLYQSEIYFIVRRDAPIDYLHELGGQRISAGPIGSAAALTTASVYRRLFGRGLGEDQARYESTEDGLARLVTDRSVDVVVYIGGQPARLLTDMRPEARQLIRFLRLDAGHPSSRGVLDSYAAATIAAANYPNLLSEDLPTLASLTWLATYNYAQPDLTEMLAQFSRSFCRQLPTLRAEGHPKWNEVRVALPPLPQGWRYSLTTSRPLSQCLEPTRRAPAPGPKAAPACASEERRSLGLCGP